MRLHLITVTGQGVDRQLRERPAARAFRQVTRGGFGGRAGEGRGEAINYDIILGRPLELRRLRPDVRRRGEVGRRALKLCFLSTCTSSTPPSCTPP